MGRGQWEQATLPLAAAAIAPAARPARIPSLRCAVWPTRVTLASARDRARGVSQVARALALGAGILWMQPVAAARGHFPSRHASWGGSVCGGVVPPAHDNAVEYARCDLACKHASVQHHASHRGDRGVASCTVVCITAWPFANVSRHGPTRCASGKCSQHRGVTPCL